MWVRPPSYDLWVAQSDHAAAVAEYQKYLSAQHVGDVLPIQGLLASAKDAAICGAEPWVVPPKESWPNIVPTLKAVRKLRAQGLLPEVEVTSVYRAPTVNQCAHGAPRSKHIDNSALDLRLLSDEPTQFYPLLCDFWDTNGDQFSLGLGFYANEQVHVDGAGYRTWGTDYRARTSPCVTRHR
jgi:hypothetical protein